MTRRPTVFLDEDSELRPDGYWYVALFSGHLDLDGARPTAENIIERVPLEEGLAWAAARAERIVVRIGTTSYSAGQQKAGRHTVLPSPVPVVKPRIIPGSEQAAADFDRLHR